MKLRIRGNSIRLRLTRSEVERISRQEAVSEYVAFGPEKSVRLEYALVVSPLAQSVRARYAPGRITIEVPSAEALEWALTEQVSIEAEQPITSSSGLAISIEKDYSCLSSRRVEDPAEHFPHPPHSADDVC